MTYPLEMLWRGLRKGPFLTKANSASGQWAGSTTLASGSATQVVSTTTVKSDSQIYLGRVGNANVGQTALLATLNSGSATVTVSDALIAADSAINFAMKADTTAQLSGNAQPVEIMSIAAQWMTVGWADRQTRAFNRTIHIGVSPPNGPQPQIEVKTISDSGYFVFGYANGEAYPRDSKILWQIENTK